MKSHGRQSKIIGSPGNPFGDFFNDYDEYLEGEGILNRRQKEKLDFVKSIRKRGLYTFQQALDSKSGAVVTLDNNEYKLLSSYDYLGLIGNKVLEQAAIDAVYKFGTGTGGVRLLTGTNKLHLELEKELALFKGTEAALTFSSGYQANMAVLSSLLAPNDVVLVDSKIHHSTLESCKLAGISFRRFEHNDPCSLERLLKLYSSKRKVLIISEGIFSMDGDICKLQELVNLKKKYGAYLMIDEAHSLGVLGKNGSGVASYFNVCPKEIDIYTGSLSKTIPASGGFVAASREIIFLLQHDSSPYIFSAALGPPATAVALMALKIMQTSPARHEKMWENTEFFRSALQNAGYNTGISSTPIIPVILGTDEETLNFSRKLFDYGIIATPVLFPAVPKGQSRIRLCVTAAQDQDFLQEVVNVFRMLS